MSDPAFALEITGLNKSFDRPVVKDLDLAVRTGEFYALLGPNGAGKTTILRMVAGLLQPEAGSISVFGIDTRKEPLAAKQIIAWVSDEPMVYDRLTPYEYLEFVAGLWNVEAKQAQARSTELIEWLGLAPHAHERCGGFSKGMLQKVALAGALVHDPKLIILDEPLTGLDAGSARQVKQVLLDKVKQGVTVIMTTHILEVAERMAERIGVINHGKLIAEGTLAELRTRIGRETTLEEIFLDLVAQKEEAATEFRREQRRMSFAPATLPWFAIHEWRLMWRDGVAMMTGGYPARRIALIIVLVVAAIVLHLLANAIVAPWAAAGVVPDKSTLVLITGSGFLFWTVMLSQALESVTRAYYGRSDLDLLLSSPASSRSVFAVRTGITAATTLLLACLLASPVIDVLVIHDGLHWLMAYLVLAALSALATAIAVLTTVALFRIAGPKRTRLIAQIIAAIIGAGFVIGIQAIAILHFGNMSSRFALFSDPDFVAAMPDISSFVWIPAKAALGNVPAFIGLVLTATIALVGTIAFASSSFGQHAIAAAGVSHQRVAQRHGAVNFRPRSQKQQLRVKEWKLLARDPWLLSQTLMQVFYLVPPALYLWISYGQTAGTYVVVIPVLVMAAGQLSGGLSWLAISGEDAHDLVVTAPVSADTVLIAKIEAVAAVIGVVFLPIVVLMLFASFELAATTAVFAAVSSGSATAIQLWFRVPMRRAMFRRRQVASRVSTISEALSSIFWAGTAVLVAGDQYFIALLPAVLAAVTLFVAWSLSPKIGRATKRA